MKINVKETVALCAVLLQMEHVLEHADIKGGTEQGAAEAEQGAKDIGLLLRCLNLVLGEVASEYFPLKRTETVQTAEGRIPFASLSRRPVDIYAVSRQGAPVAFKVYPSEIVTAAGETEVTYSYLPEKATLAGDIEYEEGKLTARVLAYGTAAEYSLISGLYDEALMWDKRYKDSLQLASRTVRGVRLPARRWS